MDSDELPLILMSIQFHLHIHDSNFVDQRTDARNE
uniref:Uncharacterized protein n=1 Tax=Tetranychus urticae TaxID=32264 RepID=T1KQ42_TETUR